MKKTILWALLLSAAQLSGQAPTIEMKQTFWGNRYEVNGKRAPRMEVELHLNKYSPMAYRTWKNSNLFEYASWGALIGVAAFGAAYVVQGEDARVKNLYGMAGCGIGAVTCSFVDLRLKQKAMYQYTNR